MSDCTTDLANLASFEEKVQVVRDRTRGVAEGYSNGFYLHGSGGISKSYTVTNTLQHLNKRYKVTNTHLTVRGLFELLSESPDIIHVIEDAESMFKNKEAYNILQSALWGQVRNGVQE